MKFSAISKKYTRALERYQLMSPRRRKAFWSSVTAMGILMFPLALSVPQQLGGPGTATYYFITPREDPLVDHDFSLELRVKSPSQSINAIGAVITFNPHMLEVITTTTEFSFCSYYAENAFDNIKGEVRVQCGTPYPGFKGDSSVIHLKMRSKVVGESEIKVSPQEARILANDGKGTNLLQDLPSYHVRIKQSL